MKNLQDYKNYTVTSVSVDYLVNLLIDCKNFSSRKELKKDNKVFKPIELIRKN